MMDDGAKAKILENAKDWFRDELAEAHLRNTAKLASLDEFNVNPFLWRYLANFLEGEVSAESLAKALILPRVLGTSISTSFGQRTQSMITRLFGGVLGSQIDGMDIEFVDQLDGRKKYCQLKAGPNIINNDDVPGIKGKFQKARNLARQNQLQVDVSDYVFGLIYGEPEEVNSFILQVKADYTTYVGQEFWYHLTGDADFYEKLIEAIASVADEADGRALLQSTVGKLATDIAKRGLA